MVLKRSASWHPIPIHQVICDDQQVCQHEFPAVTGSPDNIIQTFNVYGASKACDMLAVDAMIHPAMPAHLVCRDLVWPRF